MEGFVLEKDFVNCSWEFAVDVIEARSFHKRMELEVEGEVHVLAFFPEDFRQATYFFYDIHAAEEFY